MTDLTHLHALELRLSHERGYLARAKTDQERQLRRTWIAQIEREIAGERAHLGLPAEALPELTDDELFNELTKEN